MEKIKDFGRAVIGLTVGVLFAMCAVGSFGHLISDGHCVFAVANAVTVVFAAKPVKVFVANMLL